MTRFDDREGFDDRQGSQDRSVLARRPGAHAFWLVRLAPKSGGDQTPTALAWGRHASGRRGAKAVVTTLAIAAFVIGCDARPQTTVVIDNDYPSSAAKPLIVYRAYWQAVSFQDAIVPGSSSDPQSTVPASSNTAYVVLAPGWDPTSSSPPTSFVFLQSRNGFDVALDDVLHIPVDDATFIGNCASGSFLSQSQADFIIQRIFTPTLFPDAAPSSFRYDAATCTTTAI